MPKWTPKEDALLLEFAPNWKQLLPLMPNRTHAAIACRYQTLRNLADPQRKKLPKRIVGSSERGYVCINALVQRIVRNVLAKAATRARGRDWYADNQAHHLQTSQNNYNKNK
ncbi:MAG: hypothetical protein CMK83_00165, partial [Pseudomonadales bacterium]|nr:hypothetical protein [Pseudomonadales bacterium]